MNPSPFGIKLGIEYLFMAVIGGVGSVWGAFTGAAVVKIAEDQLQTILPRLMGASGNFEIIVFGVALVLVLQHAPQGLWPVIARWFVLPPRVPDWSAAPPLHRHAKPIPGELLLDVDRVRKQFGGLVAVNDVSFQVRAAEIVGLIGPNGAGKSTTFNLVTGVLKLSSGAVRFRGQELGGLPSREIAGRGVSRTFQHVKMIADMSVLENVALGAHLRSAVGSARAMLRLDRAEERRLLAEAEQQLQRIGMVAQMGELAGNLPLGRQRLMEIARALCADPALLLLDEPAAGLRHQEKQALAEVLRQLKSEGMSILLVEHDMDFVDTAAGLGAQIDLLAPRLGTGQTGHIAGGRTQTLIGGRDAGQGGGQADRGHGALRDCGSDVRTIDRRRPNFRKELFSPAKSARSVPQSRKKPAGAGSVTKQRGAQPASSS